MRPNVVAEAGLSTRVGQWWESIPFLTSAVVIVCGAIYLVCLLVGYDSFCEICFLPSAVISKFQVYRMFTAIVFHGSLLHVLFNILAMVPLGSELESLMGSVRLLYVMIFLAISNAILHLFITLLVSHNLFHPFPDLMDECAIGFSGILFSMIVIETNLSGVWSRSVFGLFNVPAKWYAFILLVIFLFLMLHVSLLGHLCGILSGFAYTYGLFNLLMPGTSFYSAINACPWLARLLGDSDHLSTTENVARPQLSDGRRPPIVNAVAAPLENPARRQSSVPSDEQIQKLVSMGFEKTQVEVALAAADGKFSPASRVDSRSQPVI